MCSFGNIAAFIPISQAIDRLGKIVVIYFFVPSPSVFVFFLFFCWFASPFIRFFFLANILWGKNNYKIYLYYFQALF